MLLLFITLLSIKTLQTQIETLKQKAFNQEKIQLFSNSLNVTQHTSKSIINLPINLTESLSVQENTITQNFKSNGKIYILQTEADVVDSNTTWSNFVSLNHVEGSLKIIGDVSFGDHLITERILGQWFTVSEDDFEEDKQWYQAEDVGQCIEKGNKFLGGHCKLAADEIIKYVKNIPKHEFVKIQATFHVIDDWIDEKGYMKVNDQEIWSKQIFVKQKVNEPNKCGNDKYPDPNMNIKIDKILAHSDSDLKIVFGSDLKKNPCDASYAIDDLIIQIK